MIGPELLAAVKSYLWVTREDVETDAETDRMLTGMIARGMARLQKIAGATLDFSAEDLPRQLLLDYCRYANSRALEMFERNFAEELLSLHIDCGVKALANQNANAV